MYHSVRVAISDHHLTCGKWLDLARLCRNYLSACGPDSVLQSVTYFSALAHHAGSGAPARHQVFIEANKHNGVNVVLGQFKNKKVKCKAACGQEGWGHEEKETDVNIAIALIELFMTDACDTVVIVSGDSDLAAAVRAGKRLFPTKRIGACFPYKRKSKELMQISDFQIKFDAHNYVRFQLPPILTLTDGTQITKPPSW